MSHTLHRRRAPKRVAPWLAVVALGAPIVGCNFFDRALNVTAPDQITVSTLYIPQNAQLLVNSAVGDFECALNAFVVAGGLGSGELVETTATASRWSLDRRDIDPNETAYSTNPCQSLGTYTPINTARFTTDSILHDLQGWTDAEVGNRQDLIATAAAYAGYSRILLGEMFCNAVIGKSGKLTSAQVFASADSMFTTAIAAATSANDSKILNMAYVGRARARLDAGDKTGALSDAQKVTPGFAIYASADASTSRRTNRVFAENNSGHGVTVAAAYLNLTVGGQADPRVQVTDANRKAADERAELYTQQKYTSASSGIRIASYTEAQLIIAEIQGGQTAVNIINQIRQSEGITATFASSDPAAIQAEVINARTREFFLEGQHYYDVRRFNLPQVPAAGTTYSVTYAKGGKYGSETCMPLPTVETANNPNVGS